MHEDVCCFIGSHCLVTEEIKDRMYEEIQRAIKDGYKYFVTGLISELDIIAAKIVLEERKKHDIELICYPEYEGFYNKSLFANKKREVINILNSADKVAYFYPRRCDIFLRIGTILVFSSSRAIGVFDGISRMLYDIVECAVKKGVEVVNIKNQ